MTTTRHPPIAGTHATRVSSSRISSILIDKPSVRIISTSACVPALAARQLTQVPQPSLLQIRAEANAIAADDRPLPGGPVNNQACVISWDSSLLRAAATAPSRIFIKWA